MIMIKDYNTKTNTITIIIQEALALLWLQPPRSSLKAAFPLILTIIRGCGSQHVVSSPHAVSSLKLLKSSKPKAARSLSLFSPQKDNDICLLRASWALFLIYSQALQPRFAFCLQFAMTTLLTLPLCCR